MVRRVTLRRVPVALAVVAISSSIAAAGVLAVMPASATKPGSGSDSGTARVFMVNPVQSTGNQELTDGKDRASAVPMEAYDVVPLGNLDGSGFLAGDWARVRTTTGAPAYSEDNEFLYLRNQDQFEQVMGYFWVNEAQEYLQELGFGVGGTGLPAILKRPYDVRINQYGIDNSYMWDKHDYIRLGKGGVDDAEDAEVIVHEYGHAIHHDQVDGFGGSIDAGAIGESFGDYFAVSVGLHAGARYGWPNGTSEQCPMDWDATSYDATAPHCIREFDRNLTVADRRHQVHYDGQIWSQALWEIRLGYEGLGLTSQDWDTTLIASQFDYAADTSWSAAAKATYLLAVDRDGGAAAQLVRDRFAARGITFTL